MPRDDKNKFIFENAQEILGVTESHGKKEAINLKKAEEAEAFKKRQEPYDLKHGSVRISKEIGGENNMNDKVLEWPTDK